MSLFLKLLRDWIKSITAAALPVLIERLDPEKYAQAIREWEGILAKAVKPEKDWGLRMKIFTTKDTKGSGD